MAVTQNEYIGNNSKREYDFTFPYLKQTEIKATLDGTATTAFGHPSATSIQFNTAPGTGVKIRIFRETDSDSLPATFYAGSALKSEDLNDNFTQNLYTTQEVASRYLSRVAGGTMTGHLQLGEDIVLKFEGSTDNDYETTLTVVDPTADRTITLPNITGTVITTADTGTVATTMIANDAVNGTKIADDAVDSEHIAADSLDSEHYAPGSVDTTALGTDSVTTAKITALNVTEAKIADLNVTRNKIAADAINGGKIADDSIDSEHYVDGSIDTAHIGNDQVTADKLANTSVTAGTYSAADITVDAQGRLTAASSGTIARSEIAADAIDGTKLADNAVDSEHYTDGSIDHVHLANDIIDGDNIQDDVINSEHYAAGSIDTEHIANLQVTTAKLAADAVTGAKIADDQVDSEHIAAGALDNEHYAAGSITADKLSAATVVTGGEVGLFNTPNNTSFFTTAASDARYFNISTGDTIKDGQTFPDNDTTIATTAAINDRIIDLVDDVGGFVPIANETSFPTTNPDVNNGAGTLVSIKALSSNLVSNGSGVATISNGAGSGNTVTITGLANSTTYAANFGLIVETTSTLHTYAFHRQVPIATEVSTVAGSISNVNTVAGSISNVNTVASNNSNVTTVAGVSSNVTTVAGISSNVTTVAGISSDVTAVAGDATDIGAVAAKATEIGRLGTADAVADLNTLGTTAIVSDLDTCATNVSNITTTAGSISNVNTVASNIGTVNDFAARYRVASSAPGSNNDEGDLYFDTSSNELRVYNGSSWQGGVTATGNLAGLGANTFTGDQSLGDNLKLRFGASNDLEIYHSNSGNDSYIDNNKNKLYIRCNVDGDDGGDIYLQAKSGENSARFIHDGNVELYYDSSKKFETTSSGTTVTGSIIANTGGGNGTLGSHLDLGDNQKARFGGGDDLQIYHDGSNSWIENTTGELILRSSTDMVRFRTNEFLIKNNTNTENYIYALQNGSVDLYYDAVKKFETKSGGTKTTGTYHLISNPGGTAYLEVGNGATDDQYAHIDLVGDTTYSDYGFRILRANTGANASTNIYHRGTGWLSFNCQDAGGMLFQISSSAKWRIDSNGDFRNANDSGKLMLGASNDLQIFHDGSHSRIKDLGTGSLIFSSNLLKINNAGNTEVQAQFIEDGAVELYYDGSKKLETESWGIDVTGTVQCDQLTLLDNQGIKLGTGTDFQIFHDGSHTYLDNYVGNVIFRKDNNETFLKLIEDGAVELYYDNVKKFETGSYGALLTGDLYLTAEFNLGGGGTSDANKYIDAQVGTNALTIRKTTGGDTGHETMAYFKGDGECALYYDNVKKFETVSDGIKVHGAIDIQNNEIISNHSGANNIDHIWHNDDGSAYGTGGVWNFCSDTTHRADGNSTVRCGSISTGNIIPNSNNTHDLGTSSLRWNNLYVNDMHFSNHPENPNSVDGTWGDWTLQEGENDIYMLNNRTGKKYKMALTEVS